MKPVKTYLMSILQVERIGGLGSFGGAKSHVRSQGQVDLATLSAAEQRAVESLFRSQAGTKTSRVRDGFRYKISRTTSAGIETIETAESFIPPVIAQCVKDELV